MAAALRMTAPPRQPVTLGAAGPFGLHVAELLHGGTPDDVVHDAYDVEDLFKSAKGVVILALWRPEDGLCSRADELAYTYGQAWLPIVMEFPVVRVGPLVHPPLGPCFRCSQLRLVQHDSQHDATAAIHAAYESDRACGPAGYLPHHARLAAGVAMELLGRTAAAGATHEDADQAGQVVTIRLTRLGVSERRVIQCYNCGRCSVNNASPADTDFGSVMTRLQAARPEKAQAQPDLRS